MSADKNVNPDLTDFEPPRKRAKASTSCSGSRFKAPVINEEMNTYCKGYVPQNTQKCTSLAVKFFSEWSAQRNTSFSGDKCPEDLLERPNVQRLNYWLSRFVIEVRKQNGLPYLPKSIQLRLA